PRIVPKARRLKKIAFAELLDMASLGAQVLPVRSVELAMVHKVRPFVRSSFEDPAAPGMGDMLTPPGTLICDAAEIVDQDV
ncbi:aspartate kinase, partial [Rhizobium leguminosarum]